MTSVMSNLRWEMMLRCVWRQTGPKCAERPCQPLALRLVWPNVDYFFRPTTAGVVLIPNSSNDDRSFRPSSAMWLKTRPVGELYENRPCV